MNIVDAILNLAALLLWIRWRSLLFDPFNQRTPATLVGTLRRAEPSLFRRWHLLAGIGVLLVLRALIYWWIGPALHWTGRLDLGVISLSFRSDRFDRMLSFSIFSFSLAFAFFYLSLLLLSLLARRTAGEEPVGRLIRMQLGRVAGWPSWLKMLLPFVFISPCWWLASWWLAWLEIIPNPVSAAHRIEESLVIGLGGYLVWKFAAAGLLVVHLLNTYVYFGRHPFWDYVNATAETLLAPLRKIPLRAGRVDFAPLAGTALICFAAELARRGLAWVYARLPF